MKLIQHALKIAVVWSVHRDTSGKMRMKIANSATTSHVINAQMLIPANPVLMDTPCKMEHALVVVLVIASNAVISLIGTAESVLRGML